MKTNEEIAKKVVKSATRGDDGLLDIGKSDHEFLTALIVEALEVKDRECEEMVRETIKAVFSGGTIEYKGKFFKISDGDALNFIQWEQSLTPTKTDK